MDMQKLSLATLLLFSAVITVKANDTVWGFEDQTAGEVPRGWSRMWGKQGDDLVLISNIKAADGKNSMLIDRGSHTAQWGAGAKLPDFDSGWLRVAFWFLVDGDADGPRARFGLLIRNQFSPSTVDTALRVGFHAGRIRFYSRRGCAGQKNYRRDHWYRVTLWWPAAAGDETKGDAWVCMQRLAQGGAEPVGEPLRVVDCIPARKGRQAAVLQLTTYPGKAHNNFKVYFDEFEIRQVDELPRFLHAAENGD
mgnify:CR=1 FL=1